jgi:bacterioferritin
MMEEFLTDIKTLRDRAREYIDRGPLTDAQGVDRDRIISVLNQALATEIVCVSRYKRQYFTADGLGAKSVAEEFLAHASEEEDHAEMIAARIHQLGGRAEFSPDTLSTRQPAEHHSSGDFEAMIREDLVAERVAIAAYAEIIAWLGTGDSVTRRMLEEILVTEEEHAEDMLDLLAGIS